MRYCTGASTQGSKQTGYNKLLQILYKTFIRHFIEDHNLSFVQTASEGVQTTVNKGMSLFAGFVAYVAADRLPSMCF